MLQTSIHYFTYIDEPHRYCSASPIILPYCAAQQLLSVLHNPAANTCLLFSAQSLTTLGPHDVNCSREGSVYDGTPLYN
jgi:hypothetical protein